MMTGMVLIDLQMIFDTIDLDVIFQIWYAIGFSKQTVNWFRYYLSKRPFLVNLGNNFFHSASVSYGVPQSSVLGALLFLTCYLHVKSCQMLCLPASRWFMYFLST